jgi:probable HAF family extracellular repeat protein
MISRKLMCIQAVVLFAALAIPMQFAAQDQKPKQQRYRFFDVGTFGGPTSLSIESQGVLNKNGILVGGADTFEVDPYKPDCFDTACYVQHAFKWHNGNMTDLGALPNGKSSIAYWVNSSGVVAGWSENGEIDQQSDWPVWHAVLWDENGINDLGTLGGVYSQANAMNDSGDAFGFAQNKTPSSCVLPVGNPNTATEIRAVLWEKGKKARDIGTLGGPGAFGQTINNLGQMAGFSYTSSDPRRPGCPSIDPFFKENGKKMKDLGTLGGTFGQVWWLNNQGHVVGESNLSGDVYTHAFYWTKGKKMKDLGTLGGNYSHPSWMNEAGEIVGDATLAGDSKAHPTVWKNPNAKIRDLGTLAGEDCGFAEAVNSTGQIVGMSQKGACGWPAPGMNAVLWENGQVIDLNKRIPPDSSLHLAIALEINDRGVIAGIGVPSGCATQDMDLCGHAFVLIPSTDGGDADAYGQNGESKDIPPAAIPASTDASIGSPVQSRTHQEYRYRMPGHVIGPRN